MLCRFNEESLLSDFQGVDWHNLFLGKENITDSRVPIKMLSRKEVKFKAKLWIVLGLRTSIHIKNKL